MAKRGRTAETRRLGVKGAAIGAGVNLASMPILTGAGLLAMRAKMGKRAFRSMYKRVGGSRTIAALMAKRAPAAALGGGAFGGIIGGAIGASRDIHHATRKRRK